MHRPTPGQAIARGLRKRCPRCGESPLYDGWYGLRERCTACGLSFHDADGNSWAFMYLSTGFFTGVILIVMLLVTPPSLVVGRIVLIAVCLVVFFLLLPRRKGFVLAVNYLVDRSTGAEDT